jgi:hypothetical protein
MFHFWVTLFRTKVAKVTKKQKFFGEQKRPKLQRNKSFLENKSDQSCKETKLIFVSLQLWQLLFFKNFCFFVTLATFVLKSVTFFCREMKHPKKLQAGVKSNARN